MHLQCVGAWVGYFDWPVCAPQMVVSAHRLTGTRMFKRRAGEGRITAATLWCWSEPGVPPSSDAGSFHVLAQCHCTEDTAKVTRRESLERMGSALIRRRSKLRYRELNTVVDNN